MAQCNEDPEMVIMIQSYEDPLREHYTLYTEPIVS